MIRVGHSFALIPIDMPNVVGGTIAVSLLSIDIRMYKEKGKKEVSPSESFSSFCSDIGLA